MPDAAHIALTALLHTRCGKRLIHSSDVESAVRELPNGETFTPDDVVALANELVAAGCLARAGTAGWSLTATALTLIALPDRSGLALSAEEERELFELLRRSSDDGSLKREDLTAVTRRFLEDVLAGADLPDELLDHIVEVYRARGRLAMSDDGGRYIITLR